MTHITVEKIYFQIFLLSHRLKLELTSKATTCTRKYGTQNFEKNYVRVEPTNFFHKFVVFVGKERNFVGHLKKGASGKFTMTL